MLLVTNGAQLAVTGDLAFKPQLQLLEVLIKVNGNIPGDEFDAVVGLVDRTLGGEFLFQVGLLFFSQACGDLVEPVVDGFLIYL